MGIPPLLLWLKFTAFDGDGNETQCKAMFDRAVTRTGATASIDQAGFTGGQITAIEAGDGTHVLTCTVSFGTIGDDLGQPYSMPSDWVRSVSDGTPYAGAPGDGVTTAGPVPTAIVADAEPPGSLTMTLDESGPQGAASAFDVAALDGTLTSSNTFVSGDGTATWVVSLNTSGPSHTTPAPGTVDLNPQWLGTGPGGAQITGFPYTVAAAASDPVPSRNRCWDVYGTSPLCMRNRNI